MDPIAVADLVAVVTTLGLTPFIVLMATVAGGAYLWRRFRR